VNLPPEAVELTPEQLDRLLTRVRLNDGDFLVVTLPGDWPADRAHEVMEVLTLLIRERGLDVAILVVDDTMRVEALTTDEVVDRFMGVLASSHPPEREDASAPPREEP
jgi:hypothetical protein